MRTSSNKPIVLLGWGSDGCADIDAVLDAFPYDTGLKCLKIPQLDSRSVLDELSQLLKGNKRLRILYIGAHGKVNGLSPDTKSLDKIGYKELAECLANNLVGRRWKLILWLGACESVAAADLWRDVRDLPVKLLVSFTSKPTSEKIRDVLKCLIKMSDIVLPSQGSDSKRLIYFDREVKILKRCFPYVSVHFGVRSLARVEQVPGTQRRVNSNSLLSEAITKAGDVIGPENQATRDMLERKKKRHEDTLSKARKPIVTSTVTRRSRKAKAPK